MGTSYIDASKLALARSFEGKSPAVSIDFHEAGELAIVAREDNSISLYNSTLGKELKHLNCKKYGVNIVKFTHHEQSVLIACNSPPDNHEVRYWSMYDNRFLKFFKGHTQKVVCIAFHPRNDTFLTTSEDRTVRWWDLQQENCLGMIEFTADCSPPLAAFDNLGLVFAVTVCCNRENAIRMYDMENVHGGPFGLYQVSAESITSFLLQKYPFMDQQAAINLGYSKWTSIKFSSDGNFLLVSTEASLILLLDAFVCSIKQVLRGHVNDRKTRIEADISKDSKYVISGSEDSNVYIWDREKGELAAKLSGHLGPVKCAMFSPGYKSIVSACSYVGIWLENVPGGTEIMMDDDEQSLSLWIDENFQAVASDLGSRDSSVTSINPPSLTPPRQSLAVAALLSSHDDGAAYSPNFSAFGGATDRSDLILAEAASLLKRHENLLNSKGSRFNASNNSLLSHSSLPKFSDASPIALTAVTRFHSREGPTLVCTVPEIEDYRGNFIVPPDFGIAVRDLLPFKSLPESSTGAAQSNSEGNGEDRFMFLLRTMENDVYFGASHFIRLQDDGEIRGFSQAAVVILARVPYMGLLLQRLHSFSAEVLFTKDCLDQLTNFHSSLMQISFSELGYSLAYQDLPVTYLLLRLGHNIMSLIRLILLEGRVLVYSSRGSLASASVFAFASLFPGCLALGFNNNHAGFDVRAYRWRKFGFPFDLFGGAHMRLEPLLVMAEATEVLNTPGFLAGTSNAMIQSMSIAKLDAFVDLDRGSVHSMSTPLARAAFSYGDDDRAFIQSLIGETGSHVREDGAESGAGWEGSGAWAADQFQLFFEEMAARAAGALARAKVDELGIGTGYSSPSSEASTTSIKSVISFPFLASIFGKNRTNDIANMASNWLRGGPSLSPTSSAVCTALDEYGKSWVRSWVKTNNFRKWCEQQVIPDEELLCRPTHKRVVSAKRGLDLYSRRKKACPQEGYCSYTYPCGDIYIGWFSAGKREGVGSYTEHSTGNTYEGDWREDMRHGRGLLTSGKRDLVYDGDWQNDERTGLGQCVMNGRETFIGSWLNGFFHGQGKHCDPEGNIYEGEWVNGVREGAGRLISVGRYTPMMRNQSPNDAIEKDIVRDYPQHRISMQLPDGYTYIGEWKNGLQHGLGQCNYGDNRTYSGQWREGQWWGEGRLRMADGALYEGEFVANEQHGIGVLTTPKGTIFEGTWKRGRPFEIGEWRVRYSNGDDYVGTVGLSKDGSVEPHGRGTYKYANGDIYTGEFVGGVRSGQGLCVFINGERFEGQWAEDGISLLGKGRLMLADGSSHDYT